ARAVRVVEIDLARGRVQADQAAAGEQEAPAPPADRRHHRAGVAGQLVGRLVLDLAGVLVEGHQAAAVAGQLAERLAVAAGRAAADLHQQQAALDHRRAADAEEVLHDAELLLRIHAPDQLARLGLDAVQHALRAVDVDAVAVHDRAAARAVAVAVQVLVVGRV